MMSSSGLFRFPHRRYSKSICYRPGDNAALVQEPMPNLDTPLIGDPLDLRNKR